MASCTFAAAFAASQAEKRTYYAQKDTALTVLYLPHLLYTYRTCNLCAYRTNQNEGLLELQHVLYIPY